jgi:hypothetical protein
MKSKEDEMDRACSTHGREGNACRILMVKPEGKRPLRKPRNMWEHNIKIKFRNIGLAGIDWINVV